LPFLDREIEWTSIRGFLPDAQDYYGHEGVIRWFEQMAEEFMEPFWEVQDVIDAGERIVVASKVRALGKRSGVPVEINYFPTITFVNGKVVRVEAYLQRTQALEAVGLRDG